MKPTTLKSVLYKCVSFSFVFVLVVVFLFSPQKLVSAIDVHCNEGFLQNVTVDGVNIEVCLPFQADYAFSPSKDEITQSASITRQTPFQQFLIYAVPYSVNIGSSVMQVAEQGISTSYAESVRSLFELEGEQIISTPPISIFDQSVPALVKVTDVSSPDQTNLKQINAVWVLETGNRLWILQYVEKGAFSTLESANLVIDKLQKIFVRGSGFETPSVSLQVAALATPPDRNLPPPLKTSSDLAFPSWWSGDCNVNNHTESYWLGGVYRGLKACGPKNTMFLVNFGVGNGQYEWQCAEMSKRYLYLAFGIPPYSANGNNIVNNCPAHPQLEKVTNGTPNKGPNAGDVLSYNGSDPYGHTSIVSTSIIDANGNGSIVIVEQNSSLSGTRSHPVVNWVVQSGSGVSGWLHIAQCGEDCIPVTYLPAIETSQKFPTYSWSRVTGATAYTLAIFDKFTGTNIYKKSIGNAECSTSSNICSFTPLKPLMIGKNYKWKVSSTSGIGVSAFSPWRPFTVK